eukprot:8699842-Heterocapsa_arctica.AAC.1
MDPSTGTMLAAHEPLPAKRRSLRSGTRSKARMLAASSPSSFANFSGISMVTEILPLIEMSAPIHRTLGP